MKTALNFDRLGGFSSTSYPEGGRSFRHFLCRDSSPTLKFWGKILIVRIRVRNTCVFVSFCFQHKIIL